MIKFFRNQSTVFAISAHCELDSRTISKLEWLFSGAKLVEADSLSGIFVGPRREMITPWSTNAVEITQNMGIEGIERIEEFTEQEGVDVGFDKMLYRLYKTLDQHIFTIEKEPEKIIYIDDIRAYNAEQGLALVEQEIEYLESVSAKVGRKLTDSEVFGFSQVNSEHCRHKIFNGEFVIDGQAQPDTLFGMIRKTTKEHNGAVVSAYKDNCAFLQGSVVEQFAPASHETSDYFVTEDFESVISIKAETHNFPTTVEPFNGAATGTGGEIRDRIAGGKGAFPISGTAVYMTAYPRLGRSWESSMAERPWLYQTPEDILIKASNGASDFGNKFGQPLITGSLYTFEHEENNKKFGFDKVIMLAGGIGYGKKVDSLKDEPTKGDKVVLLGGDNYRIGMGGGAVSSVATGEYANAIELNAVQRSNPEMQKRAYNAIRAISEESDNPIISIHDHGAGGHLNCLSELVEATGGRIDIDCLPVGDPTLSAKEIVGNESQERMGLVIKEGDIDKFRKIAERERSPFYVIGEATGDMQFTFVNNKNGERPIDLQLADMFGKTPRTQLVDNTVIENYKAPQYSSEGLGKYIEDVLQLEGVACKDWLTNKVDRSVTGRIAMQQCAGEIQLPLNDCGVFALDFHGVRGVANSLGHAAAVAMADPAKGSQIAIAESLTNLVFAPILGGLSNVSLSANWMWACKNEGEDARLYKAVKGASDFAIALGINIPTGKDSLSMTQKYPDGEKVYAPGTVIITAAGEVSDVKKCVKAALVPAVGTELIYIDFSADEQFRIGGSAFAQSVSAVGEDVPFVRDAAYFKKCFAAVQELIESGKVLAGHDVSGGGLITTLLEMNFANNTTGAQIDLNPLREADLVKVLFSEKPAVVLQVANGEVIADELNSLGVASQIIGKVTSTRKLVVRHGCCERLSLDIDALRDTWFKTSYLLDRRQSGEIKAKERFENYKCQPLVYDFPAAWDGSVSGLGIEPKRKGKSGVRAAIIREKGSNGDREMAWAMHLAGFDVKDVMMTDLITGRETLEDINLIVFVGGFSNSDVLNSAKGWAGAFLYNPKAKEALDKFYSRKDTLSLGVCNGCQLLVELGLITPSHSEKPRMLHNDTHKFESQFVGVSLEKSPSIMLKSLEGSRLGVWIAHGEGKFHLPMAEENYNIALKYSYAEYPANPNGSDYNAAGICSADGRHLAMMPHPERAIKPWQWAHYPAERAADEVTPWIEMFINARRWVSEHK
ncbi:Phosphoribosylformylglycinamidine synthase [Mucinivorans hirudinis]|uniref:Phosphoribosylformylglycinamidine synthase n=1 Tax=Mucinivorans hirudinis TaxID=1433126 RepID=A0A060R8F4_9BACT|nr:Phosphoribosylformylglycinamidine synthase [Mucinivorans hirudinis]